MKQLNDKRHIYYFMCEYNGIKSLDDFIKPENISEFFFWDSNARNSAEKTLGIFSLPKVLVLQLERFQGL